MRRSSLCVLMTGVFLAAEARNGAAQETQDAALAKSAKTDGKTGKNPAPGAEELEAKFKETLTGATMSGRWCGIRDGKLTPEKEDKYKITAVTKVGGDNWLIHARVQYGDRDFTFPFPVQVKWAGDTPVIVVNNVATQGGGTYSARVVIYKDSYAGTWSGGDHSGLMHGLITRD